MNWDKVNWEKIRLFYHVAKAGSFSLAAEHLNITQPCLSRNIQILEHVTKTKLFHRHARGLKLTKEGELFFEHVCEMHNVYERSLSVIKDDNNLATGRLRILTTSGLAHIWFIDDFINFAQQYPDIALDVTGTDSAMELALGTFDIAIRGEIDNKKDFVHDPFIAFEHGLYASREYLERFGEPKSVDDLDNHRLIAFNNEQVHPNAGHVNWHLNNGVEKGNVRKAYMSFNSSLSLIKAAEGGLGIIYMPKLHPLISKSTNLVNVLSHIPIPPFKSYFIYPKQLANKKRIKLFIDHLKNCWADNL
jgi:DNA-binding transcriptional LysR family regulator